MKCKMALRSPQSGLDGCIYVRVLSSVTVDSYRAEPCLTCSLAGIASDQPYSGLFTSTLTLWGVTDCRGMVTGEITVCYC